MMEYDKLCERVASLRDAEIPQEEGKLLIALIYHTKTRIEDLVDAIDVVWIKGHGVSFQYVNYSTSFNVIQRTSVKRLRSTYLGLELPDGQSMPATIDILQDNEILDDNVTMKTVHKYKGKLVILRATRSPLAPIQNRQLKSPKLSTEKAVGETDLAPKLPPPKLEASYTLTDSSVPKEITTKPRSRSATRSISETLNEPSLSGFDRLLSIDGLVQNGNGDSRAELPPVANSGFCDAPHPQSLPQMRDSRGWGWDQMRTNLPHSNSEQFLQYPQSTQDLSTNDLERLPRSTTLPDLDSTRTKQESPSPDAPIVDGSSATGNIPGTTTPTQHEGATGEEETDHEIKTSRPTSPEYEVREFYTAAEAEMEPTQEEETSQFDGAYMQNLYEIADPKHLEAIVKTGLQSIKALESVLKMQAGNQEAEAWLTQALGLKKQAERQRTIVGVVGNTGAGKSSVINALLGEERLVPTNCMRACTAVVTELAWNDAPEPYRKYRAEIDFISEDDWRKELNILFSEMVADNGEISRETSNADSEAGIAYAKVKAVYPNMTKDDLANATIEQLIRKPHIRNHLGTTKRIISSSPDKFYRSLQQYVDSKEKGDDEKPADSLRKGPRQTEWWPLIKCVKIYLKAEALSTGAVLVDLPGVQDSNAARAAVADGYMKQCSGLWIVAPITRAVNDKAAKKLLGDQFKRQMKFDGMFSNVTFICSKTDDISVTEAIDSLGLGNKMTELEEQVNALNAALSSALNGLQQADDKAVEYSEKYQEACDLYEIWFDLKEKHSQGDTVYAPRPKLSKKRKRAQKSGHKPKKRANMDDDDRDGFIVDDDDSEISSASEDENDEVRITEPLTGNQIKVKVEELKAAKADLRKQRIEFNATKKKAKEEIRDLKAQKKDLEDRQKAICIAARNEWSRSRIQDDYAMGIKELDQECAEEEDEDNFNPDADVRDYEQVAQSLPVFCVSSRAYQTLSGHFQQDGKIRGFQEVDQTELPQLKEHCMRMTVNNRIASSRMFLENLTRMLLSMSLWSSNDGSGVKLSNEEKEQERKILGRRLLELEKALDAATESALKSIKGAQVDHIQKLYHTAIANAENGAYPTAEHWGAHRNDGGFVWSTYKALVRRLGGPFSNQTGTHDLNKQLSGPFERYLVSGWERCFQRTMPAVLKSFGKSMGATVKKFHEKISERARTRGVGIAGIGVLTQKLPIWEQAFEHLGDKLNAHISEKQKEANREITPVITSAMEPAYTLCVNESGTLLRSIWNQQTLTY
jgi:GTPase SAR1 family protein